MSAAIALNLFAVSCDEEKSDKCDPNDFSNYCQDDEVICYCDSETKKEKCASCDEDCFEWGGHCVTGENAIGKCECNSSKGN
jgi:hypothetical protein